MEQPLDLYSDSEDDLKSKPKEYPLSSRFHPFLFSYPDPLPWTSLGESSTGQLLVGYTMLYHGPFSSMIDDDLPIKSECFP